MGPCSYHRPHRRVLILPAEQSPPKGLVQGAFPRGASGSCVHVGAGLPAIAQRQGSSQCVQVGCFQVGGDVLGGPDRRPMAGGIWQLAPLVLIT